jgi:hypothetical protein
MLGFSAILRPQLATEQLPSEADKSWNVSLSTLGNSTICKGKMHLELQLAKQLLSEADKSWIAIVLALWVSEQFVRGQPLQQFFL